MYSVVLKVPVLLCEGGHSHCGCEKEGHTPPHAASGEEDGCGDTSSILLFWEEAHNRATTVQ